ncbi:ferritin [Candidatus Palauibacter sp.]|uniref:ferritin n=1 Tax=Candidatus Palauibacter sp. TaxID=3101350 RepID=UPI003B021A88
MIGTRMQAALNEQITQELYASQVYLSMCAHFEGEGLPGFAHWMRAQAEEEREHALRIFDFVHDREGQVSLRTIDAPPSEFGTPREVFEEALGHERKVSEMIGNLYRLAMDEADYPAQVMLQWFVNEQVEEEKTISDIVDRLRLAGDDKSALLMLETELGQRTGDPGADAAT